MTRFIVRRVFIFFVQLLAVTAGVFVLLRLLPADPVSQVVGQLATPGNRRLAEVQLGLDQSLGGQLWSFLQGLLRGDLGDSWATLSPVRDEIIERAPVTLQIIVPAFLIAITVAILVGRVLAVRPGGRLDKTTAMYSLFAGAQPDFWWGLIGIYLVYFTLGWAPAPLGLLSLSSRLLLNTRISWFSTR